MKTSNHATLSGLLTSVLASICCIVPVLSLTSGVVGISSTFAWIEPYRQLLIGLTLLILSFAWYQKLKPLSQSMDCICNDKKPKFIHSKTFLFLVTLFAGVMLAFPYYSHLFYPDTNVEKQVIYVSESDIGKLNYSIQGMTCAGCEAHIEHEVNQLEGILEVDANHETSSTTVKYNKGKVTPDEIATAIRKTGYKIIE